MEHRFKVNSACICKISMYTRRSIIMAIIDMQGLPHLAVHEMKENVHEVSSGINDMFRNERGGLHDRHGKSIPGVTSMLAVPTCTS